ncbi:MAG TPA: TetR/AcrR family transcriptional regulator [Hyphomicrobium sp.]|nr:TetR/AcrR family transcriptional regulator [Hyphomicrobium sp.]
MTTQTRPALLKEAEALIRTRGYSAFSYADLAERVGIRKASIHHHFPTKEALGAALVDEYLERFLADLAALRERELDTVGRLNAYGDFFASGLKEGLMPLCGALASDVAFLPASMKVRVERFFRLHLDWLEDVLKEGVKAKDLRSDVKPQQAARLILSVLQGASLIGWALKEPGVVKPALKDAIASLTR